MIYTILTILNLIHNAHWQNNDHHPRQLGDCVAREPSRDHHFVVTALRGDDIQVNNDVNNDIQVNDNNNGDVRNVDNLIRR